RLSIPLLAAEWHTRRSKPRDDGLGLDRQRGKSGPSDVASVRGPEFLPQILVVSARFAVFGQCHGQEAYSLRAGPWGNRLESSSAAPAQKVRSGRLFKTPHLRHKRHKGRR